jgi:hypothetical protein
MDPVFFLHIPKTAGTSLRLWLKQAMLEAGSGDLFFVGEIAQATDEDLASRWLLAAHAGVDVLDRLRGLRPGTRSVTVLRQPESHAASAWAYYRGLPAHVVEGLDQTDPWMAGLVRAIKASTDLQTFATSSAWRDAFSGFQTRYLATGVSIPATARAMLAADADTALIRLADLTVFGLVEHPLRTAAVFCDALVWPWLGPFGDHNPGSANRPSPTELAALDLNVDRHLYAHATDLFEQRWADLCTRMGAEPAAPDQGLAGVIAGLDARALETLSTDRMGWTGVEDGLFARGLGERFFYEPEGRWLRNVTGELTLFAPCPADARRLSLCFGYILPDPEKTALTLNGMATSFVTRYEQDPGGAWRIWLDADLPADRENAVTATVSGATGVRMQGSFLGFAIA